MCACGIYNNGDDLLDNVNIKFYSNATHFHIYIVFQLSILIIFYNFWIRWSIINETFWVVHIFLLLLSLIKDWYISYLSQLSFAQRAATWRDCLALSNISTYFNRFTNESGMCCCINLFISAIWQHVLFLMMMYCAVARICALSLPACCCCNHGQRWPWGSKLVG